MFSWEYLSSFCLKTIQFPFLNECRFYKIFYVWGRVHTHTHLGVGIAFRIKTGFYNSCFNGLLIFRLQLMGNRKSSISSTPQEAATWTRPRWWSQRTVKSLVFQEGCSRLELLSFHWIFLFIFLCCHLKASYVFTFHSVGWCWLPVAVSQITPRYHAFKQQTFTASVHQESNTVKSSSFFDLTVLWLNNLYSNSASSK